MMTLVRRWVWAWWGPIAERAARAYIAGPELDDALRVCEALARRACAATICPWDGPNESPRVVADSYITAVRGLAGASLDCSVSIKAPSLGFSPELVAEILAAARPHETGIHFDSLALETADQTWSLLRVAARQHPAVGCTLPARWSRSVWDADQAIELRMPVRVIKGQWADPAVSERDIRPAFLGLIERLAGRARRVAVATHDPVLASAALVRLARSNTPCELELLYGLPARAALAVAEAAGIPVRFYVPYGHAWLPYGLSQARKNPRILWWTLRDWLLGWRWPGTRRLA